VEPRLVDEVRPAVKRGRCRKFRVAQRRR
jgi:hypothetical protein